ncbi:unnamed protein product [Trichogramma brassicae]|uniref:Major facilitator superfamily (MFS) profile domain-containing protein n=1 Tax=Trichogramma brassicae TaxID=86971 RepID=A0A6H5IQC9_9HYME|nr:unnamed protein product [Trichogramma brassicae]
MDEGSKNQHRVAIADNASKLEAQKQEDEEEDEEEEEDPLTKALDKLGEGSGFLWMIFFFTMLPPIFAGMHSNTYIFMAEVPRHWCEVGELRAANWTTEQIQRISVVDECRVRDYDYRLLAGMGFEESLVYAREHEAETPIRDCGGQDAGYYYEPGSTQRYSMVQEWDLVCGDSPKRATTHMALSLGKLLGAGVLGVSSDRYGRRAIYVLGILLFVLFAPVSAYVPWYWAFIALRLLTGISFSAVQYSALTTLTEAAGNTHRQWMGIAFNCGFASGPIFVAGISYLATSWRQIQAATSLPGLLLLLFMWFMPESPRWLLSQGRRKEARAVLERFHGPIHEQSEASSRAKRKKQQQQQQSQGEAMSVDEKVESPATSKSSSGGPLNEQIKGLKTIFSHGELAKRACISYFSWMTASLTYYALALNVDNFAVDYYLYAVLLGVTEIPAYLVPSPILLFFGRKQASSALYGVCGALLLLLLGVARTETALVVTASLVARFCLSAAYGIFILYTSEFFPTISRNSALGTSSALAHVGSIVAPFLVDGLGRWAWWGPSTFCGSLALLAAAACLALPETRGRPLADTVEEEIAPGRGRVSFACADTERGAPASDWRGYSERRSDCVYK